MAGWIKLHRKLKDSTCFQNEKLLKVWVWCLLKATHSERKQLIGRSEITLLPGQFPTGRIKAASELSMKPSTAWEYILLLQAQGNIDIKSNNKYSVVTVVNWASYQFEDDEVRQQTQQQIDSKSTANRQQIDTNNNVKNEKNEKNVKKDIYIGTQLNQPSIEEVREYCNERNNGVDAIKWHDFYSSKGWMVGKNKMKDWKAAVRTWERNTQRVDKPNAPNFGAERIPKKSEKYESFYLGGV